MAQYRTGTVNVTNGSQTVTGDTTLFVGNVSAGDLFTVVGSQVDYKIASVTNNTTIVLNANYAGATQSGAAYTISTSFTPTLNLPYIQKGDIETATILASQALALDALVQLDMSISGTPSTGQIIVYNGTEWTNATLAGSVGEVTVTDSGSTVTLSLPQSIATTATPTFAGLTINGTVSATLFSGSGASLTNIIQAVSGTTGQINASTTGTTATISLPTVGTAGTYGSSTTIPIITTDAYGRVSAVSTETIASVAVSSIAGTANEIIASSSTGAVTLSLPQAIATTSSPTFLGLTVGTGGLTINGSTIPITYVNLDNYVSSTIGFCTNGVTLVSGSNVVTLNASNTSARFTSAMVGMSVNIANGSSWATIASYISPTQVTINESLWYSTSQGNLAVFETGRDDTSGIAAAVAAATAQKARIRASNRAYIYSANTNLNGIQGMEGESDNSTWFIAKTPSTSQKGNCFTWANAPLSPVFRNIGIQGPATKTPAYLSSMTMLGGQLTAVVTNSQTMDSNAAIQLWGARNSAFPLRWTRFVTTGTPTSTGFTASAVTWDGRQGYASVSNVSITSGVITITTSATNTFESVALHVNLDKMPELERETFTA